MLTPESYFWQFKMEVKSYFDRAMQNEEIFRRILRDLKDNRARRSGGTIVPENLETEAGLDLIFQKYSDGIRTGKFTITDFRFCGKEAILEFQKATWISGEAAELRYRIEQGSRVKYAGVLSTTETKPSGMGGLR